MLSLPLLSATSLDSGSASATFGIETLPRLHLYSILGGFATAVRLIIFDFPSSISKGFLISSPSTVARKFGLSERISNAVNRLNIRIMGLHSYIITYAYTCCI